MKALTTQRPTSPHASELDGQQCRLLPRTALPHSQESKRSQHSNKGLLARMSKRLKRTPRGTPCGKLPRHHHHHCKMYRRTSSQLHDPHTHTHTSQQSAASLPKCLRHACNQHEHITKPAIGRTGVGHGNTNGELRQPIESRKTWTTTGSTEIDNERPSSGQAAPSGGGEDATLYDDCRGPNYAANIKPSADRNETKPLPILTAM